MGYSLVPFIPEVVSQIGLSAFLASTASNRLPGVLPGDRECFFDRQGEKAKGRAAILALSSLCGDLPTPELAVRLADAERDLAELHATREQLVDSMNRSGIHVDHRPEVVARRVAQQRADDRAAEQPRRRACLQTPAPKGTSARRPTRSPSSCRGGVGDPITHRPTRTPACSESRPSEAACTRHSVQAVGFPSSVAWPSVRRAP